ncbi:MAG: LamG domain-containing protein, partial [Candidatus Tectomicrobia bacterium]
HHGYGRAKRGRIGRTTRILALSLLLMVAAANSSLAQTCVEPPSGILAWWPGDENADDISGNDNHAQLEDDASAGVSGKVNGAFLFDGAGDIADTPLLLSDQGTIELWINPTSLDGAIYGLFGTFSQSNGNDRLWVAPRGALGGLGIPPNKIVTNFGSCCATEIIVDSPFIVGNWTHLAITFDYNANFFSLYIDGQQVATAIASRNTPTLAFSFGGFRSNFGQNFRWPGLLDEVTIYDRVLSAMEIQDIFNAGSAGKCIEDIEAPTCVEPPTGLVSWWPGEENADDISGNAHHAQLQGSVLAGVPGQVGNAFQFDGIFGGADNLIDTPITLPVSGTIEFWITPSATLTSVYGILGTFSATSSNRLWIAVSGPSGGPALAPNRFVVNLGSCCVNDLNIPNPLTMGEWTHIGLSFDYVNDSYVLYVNGEEADSSAALRNAPTELLSFGGFRSTFNQDFRWPGLLDEVTVYDRVLSATEVQDIFNAGSAGKCIGGSGGLNCVKPPSGILAWWPGEENADDISGNENHGILGDGTSFEPGQVGQTFSFDGVDDRIIVENEEAFDFITEVSVETWVFSSGAEGNYQGVINKGYHANGPFELRMTRQGGSGDVFLHCASDHAIFFDVTTTQGLQFAAACLTKNVWHHVAGMYDGTEVRLYLDGELAETRFHGGTLIQNDLPVSIGWNGLFGEYWSGLIDEVSIYDRALSSAEVQSIFNAGSAGKCTEVSVPGDLDGDGDVDQDDLGIVVNCFGQFVADTPDCAIADVAPPPNGDGVINILDVSFVGSHFTP